MSKIQSTIAHGKTTIASMILQVSYKYKMIGNNDERNKRLKNNYKIAIELFCNTKTS
jgi:hypothetical protein